MTMFESAEDRIKITYFTQMQDLKSSTIALFGCYVTKQDLYFSKMKLVQKKDGGIFIAPPSEKYVDPKTGQDAYSNFFWYGNRTAQIFQETALEAIKAYCLRKGIPYPPKPQQNEKETVYEMEGSVQEDFIPF
jgi:hypothetical protein